MAAAIRAGVAAAGGAFAVLLYGEFRLAASGEPPAQAGARLEDPRDMTELADVTGLPTLPGAQRLSQFMIYLAASPGSASAVSAVDRMTRQMVEGAPKVDLVRTSSFMSIRQAEPPAGPGCGHRLGVHPGRGGEAR